MTGGRILRLKDLIGKDDFMVTYGDAVSDVNIAQLVEEYKTSGALAMVTSVHPTARFGELTIDEDHFVRTFKEKPQINQGWINGGFFVLNYKIFDYIKDDLTVFEKEPLERLAADGELKTYCHEGFWQCMDTVRDRDYLNNLWNSGKAPWVK
jgi:glucose-1-phosphate cytidylyltransferase